MRSRESGAVPEKTGPRFLAFILILLTFLLFPVRTSNLHASEPVILPEKIIIGEDRSIPYLFSPSEDNLLSTPPTVTPFLEPPPLPEDVSRGAFLSVSAGYRDKFTVRTGREKENFFFFLRGDTGRKRDFPDDYYRLTLGIGGIISHPDFEIRLSLAPELHKNLPAAIEANGNYEAGSFPAGWTVNLGASAVFLPEWPFKPQLALRQHIVVGGRKGGRRLLQPALSGEAGFFHEFHDQGVLRLYLSMERGVDYGNRAHRSPDRFLTGLSLSWRIGKEDFIFLDAKNPAGRNYEVLPGVHGPGASYLVGWHRSF